MSYGFSVPAGTRTGFRARAIRAATDCKQRCGASWVTEADGDIDAAISAAAELANQLVTDRDTTFQVTISGHANAGRQAPAGWSADTITVSVSRVPAAVPAGAGG